MVGFHFSSIHYGWQTATRNVIHDPPITVLSRYNKPVDELASALKL